jgi:1,4-dihydroxy-6-naphthoate synthase
MTRDLTIGYSPCPNDTFLFYALMHNFVPLEGAAFAQPVLDDVETLNRWALKGKLDVTKLSFHALGHVLDRYEMLSAGAALGRGCGPLLIARPGGHLDPARATIAIPGEYTTAALLLKLYLPEAVRLRVMRFEEIVGAVAQKRVDCGVIIHESRFTYRDHGLECLQDLGQWWEKATGLPVPLGCIAARRTLGDGVLREIDRALRASVQWAQANPGRCMAYIRRYAQEMDEGVLHAHIGLYVNDFTLDIGEEGRAAVKELLRRGRAAGIFAEAGGDMSHQL